LESVKELAAARESRIFALESELERLKVGRGDIDPTNSGTPLDDMSIDDLKAKLRSLESQYSLLSNELPSMEAAWRKTQALAAKKVSEIALSEEQLQRLSAEKSKADQKYFAAMKAKDARDGELRSLKAQNAKTSEIVTQLKEAESAARALSSNLEKQLAESKESLTSLSQQNRALQQKVNEASISSETLKTEITKLKELLGGKDTAVSTANSAKRSAEVELEECKVRLEESKKQVDGLRKRSAGRDTTEADDWRVSSFSLLLIHYQSCPREMEHQLTLSAESRHLSRLQFESARHDPQTVRTCLLPCLRTEPHQQSLTQMPVVW